MENKFKVNLVQKSFYFGLKIIKLCDDLPQKRSAWVIADQIIRSSTSIGANLVEAKASSSRLEFKKFYEIALKSANETMYWLELLKKSSLSDEKSIDILKVELDEISRMIASSVIKLKNKISKF